MTTYTQRVDFQGVPVVTLRWPDFKALVTNKKLFLQHVTNSDSYTVFAMDGGMAYQCRLVLAASSGSFPFEDDYSQGQNDTDTTDFETNFKPFSNQSEAPRATDGKPFVLPNSFPGEVLLNFAGVSDSLSPAERYGGALFGLQQVGVGEATFTVDLLDGIFLAGGHVDWSGGSYGSSIYMELVAPASTTKAPAVANQGNCNKVALGGGKYLIVPAAGNGQYDLDTVVPIPANDTETNAQNGYWTYSEPWCGKGTITPGSPGSSKYNLLDFEVELAHFAKLHLMLDTGQRDMIAPAIKPKWILPEWKMKVTIDNADAGKTLSVDWDLLIARRKSA